MGTYAKPAKNHYYKHAGMDTYIPPYSILNRIAATSTEEQSAGRGQSSHNSAKLLNRLAFQSSPSSSPSQPLASRYEFRTKSYRLDSNSKGKDLKAEPVGKSTRRCLFREPRRPQHVSFGVYRGLNKGCSRLTSTSGPSFIDVIPTDHEEDSALKDTLNLYRDVDGSPAVRQDETLLADRLSVPPLSARIAPGGHADVSDLKGVHQRNEAPVFKRNLEYATEQDMHHISVDDTLEEGELQEDVAEVGKGESGYTRSRVLVRHLEPGTTPQDVLAVFKQFGEIVGSYAVPCASSRISCHQTEDILVDFADPSSAARAVEEMDGIMADGRIISVVLAEN